MDNQRHPSQYQHQSVSGKGQAHSLTPEPKSFDRNLQQTLQIIIG